MDNMFFDPKTLTNDQLFEKQVELERKKVLSSRFGKAETLAQLQAMLDAINKEREERMFQDIFGKAMMENQGLVVETDPDIREQIAAEKEAEEKKAEKARNPIRRPIRSSKPIKSEDYK